MQAKKFIQSYSGASARTIGSCVCTCISGGNFNEGIDVAEASRLQCLTLHWPPAEVPAHLTFSMCIIIDASCMHGEIGAHLTCEHTIHQGLYAFAMVRMSQASDGNTKSVLCCHSRRIHVNSLVKCYCIWDRLEEKAGLWKLFVAVLVLYKATRCFQSWFLRSFWQVFAKDSR